MMRLRLLGMIVLLAVAACAPTGHWENPSAPKERWAADQATCQRLAAREAEREYAKQSSLGGRDELTQAPSHGARMAVYEIKKFEARVFDDCMKRKGYRRAEGGGR